MVIGGSPPGRTAHRARVARPRPGVTVWPGQRWRVGVELAGRGRPPPGSGVGRSLLPGLAGGHWWSPAVSGRAGVYLMVRFYELLCQGHGPSDALRTVQLEHHAAGDPVLNWGAFVCYARSSAVLRPSCRGEADPPA
ncbi:CHAT domain-containing protein [Actinomadura sp. NBRC 104425]|uniref:CHAT domain-containing protein n=1 Tax=Actinomadura sp. NBRC 104425 TaxID=3032204 RepID=UPI00332568C7